MQEAWSEVSAETIRKSWASCGITQMVQGETITVDHLLKEQKIEPAEQEPESDLFGMILRIKRNHAGKWEALAPDKNFQEVVDRCC